MKRTEIFVNKMCFYFRTLLILIVLNSCNDQQPMRKEATAKTKEILDFVIGLPKSGMFVED